MRPSHLQTLVDAQGKETLFTIHLGGLSISPADDLFVVGDNLVKVFDKDGQFQHEFELSKLGWCVLAEEEAVWVGMDGCLAKFAPQGERLAIVRDEHHLGRITSIAAIGESLFVADATHRIVREYSRDGEWLGDVGADVNTRGFMIPNGLLDLVADPSSQTLLVAHPQKHRVERYAADGELIGKWGQFGMHSPADFGGCCNPTNIAASVDGLIAVSEKAPPRIKVYDPLGTYQYTLPNGVFDESTKNIDLAFDSSGKLYATDPHRRAVEVFELATQQEPVS